MRAILLIFCLILNSCNFATDSQKSIILIAVEGLNFTDVTCEKEFFSSEGEGIQMLCSESVRFTHAYTPSTMTKATIASVLTGLYPYDHKVHDNGPNYLPGSFISTTEVALENGYKTALFSGGLPIQRNSGLQQGFEVFNDKIRIRYNAAYRSAQSNVELFKKWHENHVNKNFFTTFYFKDLLFPHVQTKTNRGEIRERNRQGQLLEISESISNLITYLKSKNSYNSTTIILFGTNGKLSSLKKNELPPYSLRSENTQVTLLIKPSQKKRDLSINWKIDSNVSLADIGNTLFNLLGSENKNLAKIKNPIAKTYSLLPIILKNKSPWEKGRLIVIESGWPKWKTDSNIRYALRRENYFIEYDNAIKVYNTLVDQKEEYALTQSAPLVNDLKDLAQSFFNQRNIKPWRQLNNYYYEKYFLSFQNFKIKPDPAAELNISKLFKSHPKSEELKSWLAHDYIKNNRWKKLKAFAHKTNQEDLLFLANQNLNIDRLGASNKCLKLLENLESEAVISRKICKDNGFIDLYNYLSTPNNINLRRFLKTYRNRLKSRNLARQNYANFSNWNLDPVKYISPNLVDITLHLPRYKKLRRKIKKELKPWLM